MAGFYFVLYTLPRLLTACDKACCIETSNNDYGRRYFKLTLIKAGRARNVILVMYQDKCELYDISSQTF